MAFDLPELGAHVLRDDREAPCLLAASDLSAEPLLPKSPCVDASAERLALVVLDL